MELQPQDTGAEGGISREDHISNLATDIQAKLPVLFDIDVIRRAMNEISPTRVVLLQELERWNKLVGKMFSSLIELQRALIGEVGMSDELDDIAKSLFNGQLPEKWRSFAPATKKNLASWMEHFLRRYDQYDKWVNEDEPAVIWLSGLHIPDSYLTALVQATCRKNGWPLDRSTLYTKVTKWAKPEDVNERISQGCLITGLFLEGGRWDGENECLARQPPKQLLQELPVLKVIPIEAHKLKLHGTLETPVYTTSDRRNAMGVGLVFEANLATKNHSSHWVLQGVCLTLNDD